jgi:hypothetical protein
MLTDRLKRSDANRQQIGKKTHRLPDEALANLAHPASGFPRVNLLNLKLWLDGELETELMKMVQKVSKMVTNGLSDLY